jgi:glycosyltransferase involved in cell wall biosynthesis
MNAPVAIVESSAELGGAQLSLLPVAALLARERPVVAYLPGSGPLAQALSDAGVRIAHGFELPEVLGGISGTYGDDDGDGQGPLRTLAAAAAFQRRLAGTLRRLGPTAVYLNGFRAQMGATLPARATGGRVVWHIRDFNRAGALGGGWAALAMAATTIIANSGATARQPGLRHVARRVTTVYNGVDLTRFVPRPPPRGTVLGMAAHLSPWKGHPRFLRLVAQLREELPDLRARIAGGEIYTTAGHSGYAESLRRQIADLHLEDVCEIECVSPEDMPRWLGSLNALVHCPERPEPFGRVLAEALAAGVPVVAFEEGGVPEVLGDAGVLVAPQDDLMLAALTRRLLGDAELRTRLVRAGRRRAEALFDERTYAERVACRLR